MVCEAHSMVTSFIGQKIEYFIRSDTGSTTDSECG